MRLKGGKREIRRRRERARAHRRRRERARAHAPGGTCRLAFLSFFLSFKRSASLSVS